MRITGGQSKGRRLTTLKGLKIRPTSDKVREAVFSLIGQDMGGVRVLDLFSGTGSFGVEALSRGASWALFIDYSTQALRLIRKNLELCGYQERGVILKRDLDKGLPRKHALFKEKFGLVFIDPPYEKSQIPSILEDLEDKKIIGSNSIVIAETAKSDWLPESIGGLLSVNIKIYGETKITIYNYEETE